MGDGVRHYSKFVRRFTGSSFCVHSKSAVLGQAGSQASRKLRSCQCTPLDHGFSDTIINLVSERFITRAAATTIHSPSRSWRCHRSDKFLVSLSRIHFERPFQNCVTVPPTDVLPAGACGGYWAITEQPVLDATTYISTEFTTSVTLSRSMTVDWHDNTRMTADYTILTKLIHVLGGVYIWDFVLNLDFEYSVLTGKRKLTWTSPLYLGCRWSSLSLVIVQFLALDGPHVIDCQGLIALRVIALWEHNKIVVAITSTSWFANVIIYVYSTVKAHGNWFERECMIQHTYHSNISVFSTLAIDLLLLTLMLIGLLRWKFESGGIFQLMYVQGLVWVLVVVLAEIPPAVFIALNLNDPMNMLFEGVGLIVMSIGASRIYRGLVNFPCFNSTRLETAAMDQLREPQPGSFVFSLHRNTLEEGHVAVEVQRYIHTCSSTP
ncbi:hypothetical protein H4582DRAFT_1560899 [Lactarius indigo]|nr:hypothetical protein H4582DRAFT_1560899 [Lactarius indigo]